MWYAIVAILILIADQGLKYWVTLNIPLDTGHGTLIPGVLELTNIHNNGAAFSILQHAPHWIFVIFTVVFAAIAVFCLRRNEMMFDLEVDTDLIEQRIYERQALLCRYRYLLARARELGLHTVLTKYQPAGQL